MSLRHRQKGLGWFGILLVLGAIAFVAIVGAKCFPIYMNQFKLVSVLNKVASEPDMGSADGGAGELRRSLQRFWDIEDITRVQPKDIKLKRTEAGRFMVYDYEARERLFYNIYIVIHFEGEVQMTKVTSN